LISSYRKAAALLVNFQFARGDKFSALKGLRLGGYNFDETQDRWLQQRQANRSTWRGIRDVLTDMTGISGFRPPQQPLEPPSASNLDKWRLAMDWTKLETLEIADANPSFLDKLTGQLPALKSLKLGKGWTKDEKELGNRTGSKKHHLCRDCRFMATQKP